MIILQSIGVFINIILGLCLIGLFVAGLIWNGEGV